MPSVTILGARHLGGALIDRFIADGWRAAAVARSADTLAAVRQRGALALEADAQDPEQLAGALAIASDKLGGLDVVVNAISLTAAWGDDPFGGGPVAEATLERYRRWGASVSELGFVFLSEGARALRATGTGGTLIQVTNGSARRPQPGAGLWSSGHHGLRALVLAAAQELREEGIRACLLVVDAPIGSPKNAERLRERGVPREATADQAQLAAAVAYLAGQGARGLTYELTVTTAGLVWVP